MRYLSGVTYIEVDLTPLKRKGLEEEKKKEKKRTKKKKKKIPRWI